MASAPTTAPEQGQLVTVRQRQYVVTDVARSVLEPGPLRPPGHGPQHLVTLASIEDDALGEELHVFWELEPGARVLEKVTLPEPGGFDNPERLDAFLDAVRWGAASTADLKNIQAPFRAGIDIEDYQLDPVVRAVQMPRVNLLVADDVGLGKTIEAGMVALELILRHRARRVMVLCPASLQVQWRDQMRDKFGLDFRIVDSELMRTLRRDRGIHANPWGHFPRLITSIDFLKRERPLRLFKETLPQEGESVYPRRYDVLILDEAHNCAPSGKGKYATDSLRTQALRVLVPHFEHKLFLSATPHNGYPESFTALLELLDDQRFARDTTPDRRQLEAVMVRRLKSELPPKFDGSRRFPERKLEALEVPYSAEEKAAHSDLKRYSELRHKGVADSAEKFATDFVLLTLKKRLFSCPQAFAITLEQHERSLRTAKRRGTATKPTVGILQRQIDRAEEDYFDDSEYEEATDDAVDAASLLFREPSPEELGLLRRMKEWAVNASTRPDSKAAELIRWLETHIRPGGQWSDERVIIFTEYRATQNWLTTMLASAGFSGNDRLMTMYGGMDKDQREAVKAAFQTDTAKSPVRILLATDAASEGIDLQNHCHRLFHYEIPFNPNRLEQRNGRIDRHGQRASEVLVYHFVGKGYKDRENALFAMPVGDLEDDLEFLMRAARKVETIREDLGEVGPVIARQVEEAMLGRRSRLDTRSAEEKSGAVKRMLKFERDLARQIKRLRDQLDETRRELRLSPENIQKVVEVALELAGQPRLIPTKVEGIWPHPKRHQCPVFRLPALSGSWGLCAEGLRHPHTGEVRPVVFDHAILAEAKEDVVLVHLNHRLVQMALRLLRAEVWSGQGKKNLHRVTARLVPDVVLRDPAVVAHARLVIVGGDSHRLHEEVITAGGVLQEGKLRAMNVGQVEKALEAAGSEEPGGPMKEAMAREYARHREALVKALEARMRDRAASQQKALADRAEKEVADVTAVLTELARTIEGEMEDPEYRALGDREYRQLKLFSDAESEQWERNYDALRTRLRAIPEEIERETAAVRARFADPQPRMFPVAVTLLVPERLSRG